MPRTQFPSLFNIQDLKRSTGFSFEGFSGLVYEYNGVDNNNVFIKNLGDINGDGIEDMAIGMPYSYYNTASPGMKIAYVVFGASDIGSSGYFDINSLSGDNGFVILNYLNSSIYYDITGVGDINNDGIADFSIGGPIHSSKVASNYIVFGKQGIGSNGTFNITTLTVNEGFSVTGFEPYNTNNKFSFLFWTVSKLGDVNGDKIEDFSISAARTNYVIFGKTSIGSGAALNVSLLTGADGFRTILPMSSYKGDDFILTPIGDINQDGKADMAISGFVQGTQNNNLNILFGKSGIGSQGYLNLTAPILANQDGFTIINHGYGYQAYSAGDVNGDGISDFIIGSSAVDAPYNNFGQDFYVVFGAKNFPFNGTLDITTLNGINGFTVTVSHAPSYYDFLSNISPLCHADINGDGIDDIFIAAIPKSIFEMLHIIVLFGKTDIGKNIVLDVPDLTQSDIFQIKFPYSDSGILGMLSSATGDFNLDGVDDVIFGDLGIDYTLPNEFLHAHVLFGDRVVDLITNQLNISTSQTVIFSNNNLNASYVKNLSHNPALVYNISGIKHGRFEYINQPHIAIESFTQQQVNQGQILFVHDGSYLAPTFNITVGDGGFAGFYPALPAKITYTYTGPWMVRNILEINQGQTVVITPQFLALVVPPPTQNATILYLLSDIQYGRFEFNFDRRATITNFTQSELDKRVVLFVQDGTPNVPSYTVVVEDVDRGAKTEPIPVVVSFNRLPVLINNNFRINQGKAIVLTSENLSAVNPDAVSEDLTFEMSAIRNGQFEFMDHPNVAITYFLQSQVEAGNVQFIPDGSTRTPSCSVSVMNSIIYTNPEPCLIHFNTRPILTRNQLKIGAGSSAVLSSDDLTASDKETAAGDLIFTADAVLHGHFEDSIDPGAAITQFSQQRVLNGSLTFFTDGGPIAPSYNISVSDGQLSTPLCPALVNFTAGSEVQGAPAASTVARDAALGGFFGTLFLYMAARCINRCKNFSTESDVLQAERQAETQADRKEDTESSKKLPVFAENLIDPQLTKLFEKVTTTNFIGYRSFSETSKYLKAIKNLIRELIKEGVDLQTITNTPEKLEQFLNRVVDQIRTQFLANRSCCSVEYLYSFVAAEIRPGDIERHAATIAKAILTSYLREGMVRVVSAEPVIEFQSAPAINLQPAALEMVLLR